jgi:hypothetical protein
VTVQLLERIRRDPVCFCRKALAFEPWSKQRAVLEAVGDHQRVAVRSAYGVGKTSIAARVVLWWLAAWPGSIVITTSATWAQVREQLWAGDRGRVSCVGRLRRGRADGYAARAWARLVRARLVDGYAGAVRGAITACPSTLSRIEREFRRLNTNTVCSIGNVPLAAVLWNGGISFGGVLAFMGSLIATIREWLGIGKKP